MSGEEHSKEHGQLDGCRDDHHVDLPLQTYMTFRMTVIADVMIIVMKIKKNATPDNFHDGTIK
jgi:hypothetical protein